MTFKQQQQSTKMWHPWSITSLVLDIDCAYSKMHEKKAGMQTEERRKKDNGFMSAITTKWDIFSKTSNQNRCCIVFHIQILKNGFCELLYMVGAEDIIWWFSEDSNLFPRTRWVSSWSPILELQSIHYLLACVDVGTYVHIPHAHTCVHTINLQTHA